MKKSFTLIELLVALAIIGIIASLLLPSLAQARKQARSSVCQNKIKQIATATFAYSSDNSDYASYNNAAATNYWNRRLSEQGYLPEISTSTSNANSSTYKCPEGTELDTYYTSSYSQNFRLGLTSDGGVVYENHQITSNHASSTVMHMDSFGTSVTLWKGNLSTNKVHNLDSQKSVARHQNKANTSFLDGHVEALNSTLLIQIVGESTTTNFWVP